MQNTFITKQTRSLNDALLKRGVQSQLEYFDGHKHIDIAIPNAKIYIEVDGLHHYVDPKQIKSDFKRDHFSDGDDFNTIRIPNEIIEKHLEAIAEAIVQIVKERLAR